MYRTALVGLLAVGIVACATATTDAAIGKLQSFNITLRQGGNPIDPLVNDFAITINGADTLNGMYEYVLANNWNGNGDANTVDDMVLKVWMPDFSTNVSGDIYFYIQSEGKLLTLNNDPNGVSVDITDLTFAGGGTTEMYCRDPNQNGDNLYAAYMFDYGPGKSYYYELPGGNPILFGGSNYGWQVRHSSMVDGDPNYAFAGTNEATPDASWSVMTSGPMTGSDYDVMYVTVPATYGVENGDVFELMVGASYNWVPEPATLGMCLLGGLFCFRRRLS